MTSIGESMEYGRSIIPSLSSEYEFTLTGHKTLTSENNTLPQYITTEQATTLSKHQLEQSMKALRAAYTAKYSFQKQKLSSNLPRIWREEQIIEFFTYWPLHLEEIRRRLLRGFFYGLRVSEIETAVLINDLVRVECKKKGRHFVYYLPLIAGTEKLFPPHTRQRKYTSHYLRCVFTDRCNQLGGMYTQEYAAASNGRRLRRYTTHTLRRTAGNLMRKYTKEVYKAKIFLRHNPSSHFGVTAAYLDYDIEEMKEDMNECFRHYVEELL